MVSSTASRQGRLGQDGEDNKVRSFTHPSGVLFLEAHGSPGLKTLHLVELPGNESGKRTLL